MAEASERLVCDGPALERTIAAMAARLADRDGAAASGVDVAEAEAPLCLVGIRTRGVPLAERLAAALGRGAKAREVRVGAIDITLYRDDVGRSQHWPVLLGTEIPFNIDGADVVLVDDVLFTGRTVRAALNALCDLGRPSSIRLAVLVDRGHRELPIQADIVGMRLETARDEHVRVRLVPVDPADEVVRMGPGGAPAASSGPGRPAS